jgi:hypothetical protein
MRETDPTPRESQSWRGWLSLIFFPTVAVAGMCESLALLAGEREPFTRLGMGVVSPGYLIGAGGVMFAAIIWIALKERSKWPVGFKPGPAKTMAFGILLLSFALITAGFIIAAIGQARLIT